jgi:polar amino acid transport system substrate-binding protein
MRIVQWIFAFFLLTCAYDLQAQGEPLRVAVESYAPPFVMQAAKNRYYGFDIDLIEAVCQRLKRKCEYQVMRFDDLLFAVNKGEVDVALSGITLTLERSKQVNFSLPYLPSRSRIMTKKENAKKHFSLLALSRSTVGIESGTIFETQLQSMNIRDAVIERYKNLQELVNALSENEVDYILLDNPSAVFWEAQSSKSLVLQGPPMPYGLGFAIAVRPNDKPLLKAIDKALLSYQKTKAYESSYEKYMGHLVNEPNEAFRPQ